MAKQVCQRASVDALNVKAEGLVGNEEDHDGDVVDRNLAGLADEVWKIGLKIGEEEDEDPVDEVVRQQDVVELCHGCSEGDPEGVGCRQELGSAKNKSGGDTSVPGCRHHSAPHNKDLIGGGGGGGLFPMQRLKIRFQKPQSSVVDVAIHRGNSQVDGGG